MLFPKLKFFIRRRTCNYYRLGRCVYDLRGGYQGKVRPCERETCQMNPIWGKIE